MSIRTHAHIQGTRWNWMNDSVFHARRRVVVSGYAFDLVLYKNPISLLAYDECWYLRLENEDNEVVYGPIELGSMVAKDAIRMSENIARSLIIGLFKI